MEGALANQRPSTSISVPRRLSSKRSSRIRLDSSSTTEDGRPDLLLSQSMDDVAVKNALGFLEKYDKLEMCDLLASRDAHWFLTSGDVYKVTLFRARIDFLLFVFVVEVPSELPNGLVRQLQPFNDSYIDVLFPVDESVAHLDVREIHQLLRELTIGVYSLNAHPVLSLEANFDVSSTCQMPTAYIDTRLGQIMINCDSWLKSVWHGIFMPREKRSKFADRWRHFSDPTCTRSLPNEYEIGGLQELSQDTDYADAKKAFCPEVKSEEQVASDEQFLLSFIDDLSMVLTLYSDELSQWKNCLMFHGNHIIQSQVKATQDRLDNQQLQRLKALLQVHEKYLRKTFSLKSEVRKYIYLLELVCFLFTVLVALKRRMKKIPNMNRLLPMLTGDEVRTERELPPFIYYKNSSSKNIFPIESETMFHLHGGIQFEYETAALNDKLPQLLSGKSPGLLDASRQVLYGYLDLSNAPLNEEYHLPIVDIDGKKYYHLVIEIEPYYGLHPIWLRVIQRPLEDAAKKKFLNETVIYETYKKYFGRKKATNYKNPEHGLRASAQRGLTCIFQALTRKTPASALSKPNHRDGLTLLHYAAIYNRPIIIGILLQLGIDVNSKAEVNYTAIGGTPLHSACRHGSFDAASCLLGNMAAIQPDHIGWTPIHHAAYSDHVPLVRLLFNKYSELLEQTTKDSHQSTPLLLSATSGALDACKCLVLLGANIAYKDTSSHTVIHLAVSHVHTNIIEYFIQLNNPLVPTWRILVDLITHPDLKMKQALAQCLHEMTTHGKEFWYPLLETGGIKRLITLLKMTDNNLLLLVLSVLCNISTNAEVREEISNANQDLSDTLSNLLNSNIDEIRSKAAILIADICFIPSNQERFLKSNAITALSNMLNSSIEDVLVNACNAIDLLCRNNEYMQNEVAKYGIIKQLTDLLLLDSKVLQGTVSSALASITYDNRNNQTLASSMGALKRTVDLMKDREFGIRYKAALAIEALAMNNVDNQREFLSKKLSTHKPLNELMEIRSSGEWSLEIREQAALSLWALGGQIKSQQRSVAECIGVSQIVTMLLSPSEKLQYVALNAIVALTEEDEHNQKRLYNENILTPLFRLLKQYEQLSHRVLLVLIRVFGVLCIGAALVPNTLLQNAVVEEDVMTVTIHILLNTAFIDVKVECCLTLSKIVLNNGENQQHLSHAFDIEEVVYKFIDIIQPSLKLRALLALTLYGYNSLENQSTLKRTNAILYDSFRPFMESSNSAHVAMACFQVIVLTRVIAETEDEQVELTAAAIKKISNLLLEKNTSLITQIAKYVSSLARIRTGITDAFLSCDIHKHLIEKLDAPTLPQSSEDAGDADEMYRACAVAIGTLTYNKTAFRLLYNCVRRHPKLYDKIVEYGQRSCMSPEFVLYFESERAQGLPTDSFPTQRHLSSSRPTSSVYHQTPTSTHQPLSRVKTAQSRLQSVTPSLYGKRRSASPTKTAQT
ncbi:unnamed protein product [Adineta ricciae]|uniref:Ankyrin and armadillo repeat-containing protein n=1 Tax=Adineta ricciae TaxID=249248 RepID=A0A815KPS6_ADIRI|nr:unnamed protein product [Adineta ricciae]